jgi:hypothetical protein
MPQTLVGAANCPHIYHDEIAISYEAEFCDLTDKRCVGRDCKVLKAIKDLKGL